MSVSANLGPITQAVQATMRSLGSGSWDLQKSDFGPLEIKWEHTILVKPNKEVVYCKELRTFKSLTTMLEDVHGVAMIRDLRINVTFTELGQTVAVGMSAKNVTDANLFGLYKNCVTKMSATAGAMPLGSHDLELPNVEAFSYQVLGTPINTKPAFFNYYVKTQANGPVLLTLTANLEIWGTKLMRSSFQAA